MTTHAQAETRMRELRRELERHNRLYYVEARPEISDREYDRLYGELQDIERRHPDLVTPDSPTQRVGGEPLEGFRHVRHLIPMLSLDKAENIRQLKLFEARVLRKLANEAIEFIVEPKVDGVSIGVHYEQGLLSLGVTRGNGTEGDDITENLRTVRSIPLRLTTDSPPDLLELRGEAFMREQDRLAVNAALVKAGQKPFPNTRNVTAGSLKLLDPRIVAQRPIRAVFYAVGATRGIAFSTHEEELATMAAFGLPVPQLSFACNTIEQALERANEIRMRRQELPYEIDGVVIKLNSVGQARQLDPTAKAPASAIAYKPKDPLRRAETRLDEIVVQVGRTGVLTPVAELESVFLDGTQISRATLHNEDEVRRKDIREGDTVVVERAGRVIPAIVRMVPDRRTDCESAFAMPAGCPACGSKTVRRRQLVGDREEVAVCCENLDCPAQRVARLEHFASRSALDIEGLGDVVAAAMVDRGIVKDPLDLFDVGLERLGRANLGTDESPRVLGEKNAGKILSALEKSRSMPLHRWLHALAIPYVGEAVARQLAATHGSLQEVADSAILRAIAVEAKVDKARELGEVGPAVASSVVQFFDSHYGQEVLARLKGQGIEPESERTPRASSALAGRTFALTGTLERMSREEASRRIRSAGGNVTGSVSRKTDYLVVGEDPGAAKVKSASAHGTPTLSEGDLLDMLGPTVEEESGRQRELPI